jgi:outer membrane protein insertion porin family
MRIRPGRLLPALWLVAAPALAQQAAPAAPVLSTVTVCGSPQQPRVEPPAGSAPVVLYIAPCFEAQGGAPLIEPQTYIYYIQLKASTPLTTGTWVPYDDTAQRTIEDDFHRLWNTNFLDNLWVDVQDYRFPNGAVGKIVTYNMEERQRVKIVDYVGSKKIEVSKINERLKDANAEVRLDTFIDPGLVRKVEGIVRDMLKEKGFRDAEVTHEIKEVSGGPKLVHLTFHMDEGPSVKIRKVNFIGNKAISSSALKHAMKENKEEWWLSWISGRGSYQETKFDEDAERVVEYYQDRGYIKAVVGAPEIKVVSEAKDKKTRYIELRVPITEGPRYSVGSFDIAGNTVIKGEALKPLFKLEPGQVYALKNVRKGLDKAREIYGAGGYYEFTGFPDYKFRDDALLAAPEPPDVLRPVVAVQRPTGPSVVDVTVRLQEGLQYFINRISFVGNTTTHDSVIRRQLLLVEDGVFNTEALKNSVKRLNQLGYFKPVEPGKDVEVQKTANAKNKVDVNFKLQEQNRNQISFGAGVSEFEGFFGQASFQTSNFLGRGESLTLSLSAGSRAQNYSLGFTEPFLFDRNITAGFQIFRSDVRYISQFTQKTTGGTMSVGLPLGNFTRFFTTYSYQHVNVTEINAQYCNPAVLRSNPFLANSLLLTSASCAGAVFNSTSTDIDPTTGLPVGTTLVNSPNARVVSKVTPSIVYNTVDQPIFPSQGKRFTAAIDLAGLGGNTNFYKPLLEGVWFWHQSNRLSLGLRGQFEYIHGFTQSGTDTLPIFEKLFLGGEYSVRGFDIRSIGPQDPTTGLVLGGNKSLLFNIEQNINIAGPVRLILFYDAGQVRDVGQALSWKDTQTKIIVPAPPISILYDPTATSLLTPPFIYQNNLVYAFKTSTGAEVRFMMPVLNVPFRLIFAYNPSRQGVLDNTLQPQSGFQFRFAVGSTF